jgi:hypothetical protein
MIDKWETACMENSEYNKRWEDLFETRNPTDHWSDQSRLSTEQSLSIYN